MKPNIIKFTSCFLLFVSLLVHPSMCLTGGRSEADYIEDITHVILMRFSQKLLHVDKKLIRMDYHLQEMENYFPQMIDPLSNDVHMVGIYEFEGIGKITISKVLYQMMLAWLGSMDLKKLV